MLAILTLAAWRLRPTWILLLVMTLGMLLAVVLACTIPLFSTVMTTAGLRNTFRATPQSAEITVNTATERLSTPIAQSVHQQFEGLLHRYLGNTISFEQSSLLVQDFSFLPFRENTFVTVYGTSMQQAAAHLTIVQGRQAHITHAPAHELEVMMTQQTATQLHVQIGSTFTLSLSLREQGSQQSEQVTVRLVGLFRVPSTQVPYWHGNDFNPTPITNEQTAPQYQYMLLVSDDALLTFFDDLPAPDSAALSPSSPGYTLLWYYHFNFANVSINDLDPLLHRFMALQSAIDSLYGSLAFGPGGAIPPYPFLSQVNISSPLLNGSSSPGTLEQFQTRIDVARIPVTVFTLLALVLVLFFVSLLTIILVDSQANTIALVRSRGASQGQVFGAVFLQNSDPGLLALLIGLPLSLLTTIILTRHALPVSELDALDVVIQAPLQAIGEVLPYGLGVVVVSLVTMGGTLFLTTHSNVLALRREQARRSRKGVLQLLSFDMIAGVIALVGYLFSLYVTSIGNVLSPVVAVLITSPLSLIAPFFLIAACLFLFARLFPLLFLLAARLAARGRGVASMLAFAQMARSPRHAMRLTVLLSLSVMFLLFALVYTATETGHIQTLVNDETGADFSADLGSVPAGVSLSQLLKQYQTLPGVLSSSVGRVEQGTGGTAALNMDIREVDAVSFGSTVIWPSQQAYRQARPLLSKLVSLRQSAVPTDVVPAIVDQTTLDKLLLHVGSIFTILLNNASGSAMNCMIVGVVNHIPTINDLNTSSGGGGFLIAGGVLVDYQTYARIFVQDAKQESNWIGPITPPPLNHVWLHTRSDAASVMNIRTALTNPRYHLTNVVDRRLFLATLQSDPLYVVLQGVLGLGTAVALVLAFIGGLLTSWLSASTRLMNFALLQALGITTRQMIGMLFWEQVIVYITAFLLGVGFGALLIFSVIPVLTFTNSNSALSNQQFFALQTALATQIVVPSSLPLMFLVLISTCGLALIVMARVTSRLLLGQVLRLNED